MTAVLHGLAAHLAALGHGVWSPHDPYPDGVVAIVLGALPADPERAVGLSTYGGTDSNSREPYDTVSVQIRVRGTVDYDVSANHAQAIYDDLHGTGVTDLPGGVRVVNIVAAQGGPIYVGVDKNDQHAHTVNVRVEHRNATDLRTGY